MKDYHHMETEEIEVQELARVYKFAGWTKELPGSTYWIEGDPYAGEAQYVEVSKVGVEESTNE